MANNIGLIGKNLDFNSSILEVEKMKILGWNTGNMVFLNSINRLFKPDLISYPDATKGITKSADKVITTDLIYIKESTVAHPQNWDYLTRIVDNIKCPIVPMSVGLQTTEFKTKFNLPVQIVNILKSIQERATIGVRGYYTAEILNSYGIKNINVIGCPSMYYWNNPSLQIYDQFDQLETFASNFRCMNEPLVEKEIEFLEYCNKYGAIFVEQNVERLNIEKLKRSKNRFSCLDSYLNNFLTTPYKMNEWNDILKDSHFSMGCRFHGNVVALWNNMKSLFVTIDSRTSELVDYFKLPKIDLKDIDSKKSIQYYYDKADYSEFNSKYKDLLNNFQSFCQTNGLELKCNDIKQFIPYGSQTK